MAYSPPRWLERLGDVLVPPASAEHSLGDLAETSRSDADYLRSLTSILPRVVWSQVRRRATLGGIAFNAIFTIVVLALCLRFPKAPFFSEPWAVLRVAGPWAIWVIGSALASAYGPRDKPHAWNWTLYIGSVLVALVVSAILRVPLTGVALGFAILLGITMVLTVPWVTHNRPRPLSLESLPDHARHFQRSIWWRNIRESIACVAVIIWNIQSLWGADSAMARAGHLLLIAGVLFVLVFLQLRARPSAVPRHADTRTMLDFHRREMTRQRDILLAVPYWYLLPFVPGMLVQAASNPGNKTIAAVLVVLVVMCGVFAGIWRLNVWAARWLDRELQKVKALEVQP